VLCVALAHLARGAFMSGMDLALRTSAAVAAGGGVVALAVMPAWPAGTGASEEHEMSRPRRRCSGA
jgi:hypothetical protein